MPHPRKSGTMNSSGTHHRDHDDVAQQQLLGDDEMAAFSVEDAPQGLQDHDFSRSDRVFWTRSYLPTRYVAVFMHFLANVICYADRTNISVAILPMSAQFGWDNTTQGIIMSAFFYGYTAFQIPGGILSGRFGAKIVLEVGIFAWSLATVLTPVASPVLPVLIAVRVVMGLGEGVNMPAVHAFCGLWLPLPERSKFVSTISSGQYIGTIFALGSAPYMIEWIGWPFVFYFFGALGFVWFVVGYKILTDTPSQHPRISPEEKSYIASHLAQGDASGEHVVALSDVPWKEFFIRMPCYAIFVAHFCHNVGWYIMTSWMPRYFSSLGLSMEELGWYSTVPYIGMFLASNTAGWVSSHLHTRGFKMKHIRKGSQTIAFIGPSVFFGVLTVTSDRNVALVCVVLAMSCAACSQNGYWANIIDISPQFAGQLCGISNTSASVAGILGNTLTGIILDSTGSWEFVFIMCIAFYVVGIIFFLAFAEGEALIGRKLKDRVYLHT
eukprot:TRINITY_DN5368_c0_g1_i1.p1 TRINITY_DN5368_c0_g1~~TRINITY_DN5368_c0_g1_i1.p1  ORF type:complete len:495 (-),score=115.78 TRINITY_DN5368_c0_g1_i1:133-1617(-)